MSNSLTGILHNMIIGCCWLKLLPVKDMDDSPSLNIEKYSSNFPAVVPPVNTK